MSELKNLKERLSWFAKHQGLSMRAFEEKCGLGRGNISNMRSDGSLGCDKLTKIVDTFPGIDIYWLLTGGDSPTDFTDYNGFDDIPNSNDPQLLNKLIKQAEEIGALKERERILEPMLKRKEEDIAQLNQEIGRLKARIDELERERVELPNSAPSRVHSAKTEPVET